MDNCSYFVGVTVLKAANRMVKIHRDFECDCKNEIVDLHVSLT